MADVFAPDELDVLREAARKGILSERQKQEIVRRSEGGVSEPQAAPTPGPEPGAEVPPEDKADLRSETLAGLTRGFVNRGTFAAVGGMVGAAASLPAGPAASVFVGGPLGAAGGSVLYDSINNFLIDAGVLEGRPAQMGEIIEDSVNEAYWDAAFGGGASLVRPILGARRIIGKISGVFKEEAVRLEAMARDRGILLGAADVGGSVPKGFLKTVSVFPYTGTPAARAQVAKHAQAAESMERILNDLAPNATIATDLGVDLAKAAERTSGEFGRMSATLFNRFRDLASKASVKEIIPTQKAIAAARELYGEIAEGEIRIVTGERAVPIGLLDASGKPTVRIEKTTKAIAADSPLPETIKKFEQYISDLGKLPELITIQQYRKLTGDLDDIYAALKATGVDVRRAGILKRSMEEDLGNIRVDLLPEGEARELKQSLETANKWYAKGIVEFTPAPNVPKEFKGKQTFETPTAGKFARSDKKFFEAGGFKAGTINQDEIYHVAVNLRSPQAISDLRAIVGDDAMRAVARRHLETAADLSTVTTKVGSFDEAIIDPRMLEKNLGLTGRAAERNAGLESLLEIGGVKLDDAKRLIESMKAIVELGDPATLVKRRAILGGSSAVLTAAAGVGGAVAGGAAVAGASTIIPVAAVTLLARHFSRVFSDPNALRLMYESLDTARSTAVRQAAFGRVYNLLTRKEKEENLGRNVR